MSERTIASLTSFEALCELTQKGTLSNIKLHENTLVQINPQEKKIKKKTTVEIDRGVNWYDYMILHDDVIALMDEFAYEQLCNMFVVCLNVPGKVANKPMRRFAAFVSYKEFLAYILPTSVEHWHFFEVIIGQQKQKFYFDIDICADKLPEGENISVFSHSLLNSLISSICTVMEKYSITVSCEKDILIFSSNSNAKHSYHVILNNYYVNDNDANAFLAVQVREDMPEKYRNYVDDAVYSKKQQLRLFKSSKPGSGRTKEWVPQFMYGANVITFDTNGLQGIELFQYIFANSCITNVEGCSFITVTPKYELTKNIFNNENNITLTSEDVDNIFQICPPILFQIYQVTQVTGTLLILRRIAKAHCTLCDRVHENENAYISVSQNYGVYFHCRRNEKLSKHLGNIKNTFQEKLRMEQFAHLERKYTGTGLFGFPKNIESSPVVNNLLESTVINTPLDNSTVTAKCPVVNKPIHQTLRMLSSGL